MCSVRQDYHEPPTLHAGERAAGNTTSRPSTPLAWRSALLLGTSTPTIATIALLATGHTGAARTTLVLLATVLATASTIPMIRDAIHHNADPKIVTWGTWCALTALAGAASLSAGDYPSAVFSLIGTLATGAVVVTVLRHGDRHLNPLDWACLALITVGLALWLTLDQPSLAVAIACLIDAIGLGPTLIGIWHAPHQQPTVTYVLIGAAGAVTTLAAWGHPTVTAMAYPLYVTISMAAAVTLHAIRSRRTSLTA